MAFERRTAPSCLYVNKRLCKIRHYRYFSKARPGRVNPISHRGGLLWPRVFSAGYNTAFTKEVVNDTNWLLRYVHHRQFKKKFKALAARHFVWRPSESRGPLIFFDFSFINFGADIFRAFRLDFWKALKSRVLKLDTNPFAWKVLIYISIDMCKETAKNLSGNNFLSPWS